MLYIVQLGRLPALSLAELSQTLPKASISLLCAELALVETEQVLDQSWLNARGSLIRIAEVLTALPGHATLTAAASQIAAQLSGDKTASRLTLGLSGYGEIDRMGLEVLAGAIKSEFQGKRSFRYILPQESTLQLTSGQIAQHDLLASGVDLSIFVSAECILLARTVAHQNLAAYTHRDEGRPVRPDARGMMPLKLCQTLLSLATLPVGAKSPAVVVDPFCGAGSILQEALLMGYAVVGSDLEPSAIQAAETNLQWLQKWAKPAEEYQLLTYDARHLDQFLGAESVDAIVSEGYLGELFRTAPDPTLIQRQNTKLRELYLDFFQASWSVLRSGGRIVLTLPYYIDAQVSLWAQILDEVAAIGYHSEAWLSKDLTKQIQVPGCREGSSYGTFLYDRPGQIIGREIILLSK